MKTRVLLWAALALLLAAGCGKKSKEEPLTGASGPYNYLLETYYPISKITLSKVAEDEGLLLHLEAEKGVTEKNNPDKYLIYAHRFGDRWQKGFMHIGPRLEAIEPIAHLEILRRLPDSTLQDVSAKLEVEYQIIALLLQDSPYYQDIEVAEDSFGEAIGSWRYGQLFHGYQPSEQKNPINRGEWYSGIGYRQRASLLTLEQLKWIYPTIFIPNPNGWELVVRLIRPDGSLLEASL